MCVRIQTNGGGGGGGGVIFQGEVRGPCPPPPIPPVSAHIKVSTLVRHIRDWISQGIYHTDFLTAKYSVGCTC